MSTEDELKLKRLSTVFVKALDMTTDSITQVELKEAFQVESGGITAVENAFVSTIGKMKQSVEVKFADICQEQGPAAILVFSASTDKENKSVQQPRAGNMTDELQAYEREILTKEIEKLSANINQLNEQLQSVNSEIFDSILPAARAYEAQLACGDIIGQSMM